MAGSFGDKWGANGGSDTPVNAPAPVMQELSSCLLPGTQLTPAGQSLQTVLSRMSDARLSGSRSAASIP